ncbi:MAG TPA: amino acid adenylation domain-containing protein, partial [Thermoanaerobaculia bacterium]|nr:amino acid adenylation domain-containing protein [Thermoanaerobaculia bacterium]
FQVKIRGFRVELGEIETRLGQCAGVRDAVVLAREDVPGDKRLVAYLVAEEGIELSVVDLRESLSRQLPDYMVPAAFVQLDALPLTANGKIDRQALPAPESMALQTREYEPPRGEIEETLAALWQDLLHVERVGRHDHFFELGGHSLLVVAMVERLRALGLRGEVRGVFASPVLCDYAATLARDGEAAEAEVPPNRLTPETTLITPELLPLVTLTQEEIDRIVASVPGGVGNIQDIYPLLPLQEGLLFHHLLETKGDTYLLRDLLAFDSRERLDRFLAVLQQLIGRHDILRTAVVWEGLSKPVQVVYRHAPMPIEVVTVSGRDAVDELRERTDPHRTRLDLRRAPLLAAFVAEDARNGEWILSLLSHHMVCDHETLELLLADVRAMMRDDGAVLPPSLPLRNLVAQTVAVPLSEHEAYFREQLGDLDEPTAPFGILDVQVQATELEGAGARLDAEAASRVRDCAAQLGVPPSVLFHVAWAQVIARCTGRADVVFGTVLSGRLQGAAGADRALGMFINTLPLRVSLESDARQVVLQSYDRMVSLLAHEQAPLVVAQRSSGVPLPLPLFTTLLNYRHSVDARVAAARSEMPGIRRLSAHESVNYPLSASVDDYGSAFALVVESCRGIDAKRIAAYFHTAVLGLVDALNGSDTKPAAEIEVLPPEERTTLLRDFNETRMPYPENSLVHELFERQAAAQPEAMAVVSGDRGVTYGDLNARANQLAHELIARGVQPDDRIAICAERGIEMMAALLGVLKAGGAYVPLDPMQPVERLRAMLHDAAPKFLLTQRSLQPSLPMIDTPVLLIDDEAFSQRPDTNPDPRSRGLDEGKLAYVIYTSGSTGTPKGVMVEHGSVVNMLTAQARMCALTSRDRVLQFAPLSFDSSVAEIFPAWSAGACVVLRQDDIGQDAFMAFLNRNRVTVADLPTALWSQWSQALSTSCDSLRLVIVSGEALESRDVRRWFSWPGSARITLINNYGPTETTVNATAYVVPPQSGDATATADQRTGTSPVPIGRPIANAQIYILDRYGRPVPIGVEGEIFIGGRGVARGYLNRPDLTAERFLPDPFRAIDEGRMYRTGDLARWRADGNIEFLGRNDSQVKIRGFRIELGEIEAKLRLCPGVREAVVLARDDMDGAAAEGGPREKRLVAYVVAENGVALQTAELRALVSKQLPDVMIPAAFVVLEAMPLTPNGKLDRKALPLPDAGKRTSDYEPPEGEIETTLAAIWQQLLKLPQVGRRDHFFELGGHSLRAITLSVHVQEQLHVTLPVKTIFAKPRLIELAQFIAEEQQALISAQEVAAMQSELESLSDEELQALLGGKGRG